MDTATASPAPSGPTAPLALASSPTIVITNIAPRDIARSPHNHRKHFAGLDELAESLLEKGMIAPITVRPHPASGVAPYEIVVGERRWRAAKLAKLTTIPAIVRDLTDKEVIEIQLVENVQRADVHPIEEAEGYEELLEKHGYDVDGIAAKIGKSKAYVYARLKYAALAPGPRAAFLEDRLSASTALLIARIPSEELQERATKEILGEVVDFEAAEDELTSPERREIVVSDHQPRDRGLDDRRGGGLRPIGAVTESIPMSVREAQIHLRRRYMLRLDLAPFAVADTQLVPTAGACTTCEFRTGNQRELFAEIESADVCTSPTCYEAKTTAAWEIQAADALGQGRKVIEKAETEKYFSPVDGRTVAGSSPYVDLKSPVPYDLVPMGSKPPTWEKLLGKKLGEQTPTVLVQDQTGAPRELLDKKAAVALLREAGKIDKPEKPDAKRSSSSGGGTETDWQAEQAKRMAARAIRERAWVKLRAAFAAAANKKLDDKKSLAVWKWICAESVARIVRTLDEEQSDAFLTSFGVKKPEAILSLIDSSEKARFLLAFSLFADETANTYPEEIHKDACVLAGLKLFDLDYGTALADAKKAAKEAEKAEAAIAAKKAEDAELAPSKVMPATKPAKATARTSIG